MATSTQLRPLNVTSFQGGINLRGDAFQLAENEVQLALNVDLDPTSGFHSRRGWARVNTTPPPTTWDPRNLHVQNMGGIERVMVANDDHILTLSTDTFAALESSLATNVVADATSHGASFVEWGDLVYIATGDANRAAKWSGTGFATLLTGSGPTWQDDYTAGGTGYFPKARFATTHMGYMFAAYTDEGGTKYPNRIRWSHVNNPEAWANLDRLDLTKGGEYITGIVPFQDYLLIFKPNSIHVLNGYDPDTWSLSEVTNALGATVSTGIAKGEQAVYFFSWPQGVFELNREGQLREISLQLRPAVRDGLVNPGAITNTWLSWANQRLYLGLPFSLTNTATDAESLLVWDPTLGTGLGANGGAWTCYRGGDGMGLGPVAQAAISDRTLGCSRGSAALVELDAVDLPLDNFTGLDQSFPMYLTTRWFDAGWPTVKKAWRRPEYVVKDRDADYYIDFQVHTDYDEAEPRRAFRLSVLTDGTTALYDDGSLYDAEGLLYGSPAAGSRMTRSSSFGVARSIRLTMSGEPGKSWGFDAILLKYKSRRFR